MTVRFLRFIELLFQLTGTGMHGWNGQRVRSRAARDITCVRASVIIQNQRELDKTALVYHTTRRRVTKLTAQVSNYNIHNMHKYHL